MSNAIAKLKSGRIQAFVQQYKVHKHYFRLVKYYLVSPSFDAFTNAILKNKCLSSLTHNIKFATWCGRKLCISRILINPRYFKADYTYRSFKK